MDSSLPKQDAEFPQLFLWIILAIIGIFYLIHVHAYLFLNDDAFISFRYADHWARTGEVVYNLGERVEGYTNFLWVALLALTATLGGDIPTWGLYLGPVLGFLNLLLTGWVSWRLVPTSSSLVHPLIAPLVSTFFLAISPSFSCWSSGGLEVQLFTLLLTLTVVVTSLGWSQNKTAMSMLGGGIAACMTMTRPEGLMFVGLLGLWRVAHWIQSRRLPQRTEYLWFISYLVIYLPYWGWRWQYYGYVLPNTYYVKTDAAGFWIPGARYLLSWIKSEAWLLLMLIPAGTYFKNQQFLKRQVTQSKGHKFQGFEIICFLWTASLCLHVAKVGGDFMANHRFLVPIMPICAALLSAHISPLITVLYQKSQRARLLFVSLCLSLILSFGFLARTQYLHAMRIGSDQGVDSIGWLKQFVVQCEHIGRWIHLNTASDTRIATTAAGAIAFYAQRPTLDILGLNDAWIAHHVPARGNRPGHTKSAPLSYILNWNVHLLIYHPIMSTRPPLAHKGYQKALKPKGYHWQVFEPPHLTPPYWGVWVKQGTQILPSPISPSDHPVSSP